MVPEFRPNDDERECLALFPGETVYRLDRIRAEGECLLLENIRLPAALFPSLPNPVPNIHNLTDTYGLRVGEAREQVCAVAASASIAKALGVAEHTLLLMSERVVYLHDGRPAEWRVTYRMDRENLARLLARF